MNVHLYTIKASEHCRLAKELLKSLNVQFDEIDITENEDAVEDLVAKTGQWSVPAIVVAHENDIQVVIGYEPDEIRKIVSK